MSIQNKHTSIMRRFVIATIILSAVSTLFFSTIIVLYEVKNLHAEQMSIALKRLRYVSDSAAFAAYNLDEGIASSIVAGFKDDQLYKTVTIKDNYGDVLASLTSKDQAIHYPRWFIEVIHSKQSHEVLLPLEFEGIRGNKRFTLNTGTIHAEINGNVAPNMAMKLLTSIMMYSFLFTCLLVSLIYLLVNHLIGRPLSTIIQSINNAELFNQNEHTKIQLPKQYQNSEFVSLVDAYNNSAARTSQFMIQLHDATDELRSLSKTDPLTSAWNRRALIEKLDEICSTDLATPNREWAVVALDLDSFSEMNDTYGHKVGDSVLKDFYSNLRNAFSKETFISRTGGDEFILLVPYNAVHEQKSLYSTLAGLVKTKPVHKDIIHHQYVAASFGIALFPSDSTSPRGLLNCSDLALYCAKDDGKGRIERFSENMLNESEQRVKLRNRLDHTIEHNSFSLCYQPKVRLDNGKVMGCEALLRLPESLDKAPIKLIEVAENIGLILPLGHAIIERAFSEFVEVMANFPEDFRLSINVSTKQFIAPNFLSSLYDLANKTNFPLSKLDVEITESTQMFYGDYIEKNKIWLEEHGCTLTLDDFGTGFASLEYLLKIGFDQVKIDQQFVKTLLHDKSAQAIVKVVKYLADQFNMTIVAEGIETESQHRWLAEMGLDYGQGYLYAKAMTMTDLVALIKKEDL
ncbi:EAL domain-containing protein [Pseudomonadota bacterium]|nr:EAL domain-containing protein [Pseudomonadota bacterium]